MTAKSLANKPLTPVLPAGATIKQFGAGGVGGIVARYGLLFVVALANAQRRSARWVIIDGDQFESANRSRMVFSHFGNKATVTRDGLLDIIADSPVTLSAIEEFVTPDNVGRFIDNDDIILMTVDNHATRKLVSQYCEAHLDRFCLISGGNDPVGKGTSGNHLRGTYGNCQIFMKGDYESPPLTGYHPEIAHPEDQLPTDLHCTELVASQPQILFANLAAASAILNSLWLYLCGMLHYSELAFDIAEGVMQPVPIPAPRICRMNRLRGFTFETLENGHVAHVGRLPKELLPSAEQFEVLWALHPREHSLVRIGGRTVPIPRWQKPYERDYEFSGQTAKAAAAPPILGPYLRWSQQAIDSRLNGILVNWYDGSRKHYIGPHHDDVRHLIPGSPIVTISLGEERIFRLTSYKKRQGKKVVSARRDLSALPGSVIVLPWETNLEWKHSVPHFARFKRRRISITIRAFE